MIAQLTRINRLAKAGYNAALNNQRRSSAGCAILTTLLEDESIGRTELKLLYGVWYKGYDQAIADKQAQAITLSNMLLI